jgi:ParB family chromosome partitioning protein
MTKDIKLIPLEAIDPKAMERDRVVLEPEPLRELVQSIAINGLRMPVEVYELPHPGKKVRYGLISGFRRLTAFHELREMMPNGDWTQIPAFVREPSTRGEALTAMI